MGTINKYLSIIIICTVFSCNNDSANVTKDTFVKHFAYPVSHKIAGFEHYINIGESKVIDTSLLLVLAKRYTDTVTTDCPVFAIIFLNKLESFPKELDDQDWGLIRKNFTFEITYNEDSLQVSKYVINKCYHWHNGERIE